MDLANENKDPWCTPKGVPEGCGQGWVGPRGVPKGCAPGVCPRGTHNGCTWWQPKVQPHSQCATSVGGCGLQGLSREYWFCIGSPRPSAQSWCSHTRNGTAALVQNSCTKLVFCLNQPQANNNSKPEAATCFCKKSGATHEHWTPQGLAPPNWQKQVLRARRTSRKTYYIFVRELFFSSQ